MKTLLQFIKTTIVGGLLVLIPLVLIVVLIGKALDFLHKIVAPLVNTYTDVATLVSSSTQAA